MKKLVITTLALTLAFTGAIAATATTTTEPVTPAQAAASEPAAGKKKVLHKKHHAKHGKRTVRTVNEDNIAYTEMRVGDPRIVYHEIGTAGSQNGNTIVPFYDEPIRSAKPYEIRYDYAEFGRN